MNKEKCPHCSQVMAVYSRSIRKGMLNGLINLRDFGPARTCDLGLPQGPRSDFTILRFFGLIYKPSDKPKRDLWKITQKGVNFLNNKVSIPKAVYIFNNNSEGYSIEKIFAKDVDPSIFDREEHLNLATPKSQFKDIYL